MQKNKLRALAILLLALSLFVSCIGLPACAKTENTASSYILAESANEIDTALRLALENKAASLENLALEYEGSGEIVKDANGDDVDMAAYIAHLRERAAALRGIEYIPYELAIIDDHYARFYIGVYRSVISLVPDMVNILAEYGNFSVITDEVSGTEALLQCYVLATEDTFDSYVDRETAKEENESPTTYVGIGVSVVRRADGYIDIIAVTEGAPAQVGGIVSGDILIAVDGTDISTIDYNEVLSRVRGEEGTTVTLTLRRGDQEYTVTLTRATVQNVTVTHKMLTLGNGKTGYVRISEFGKGTFTEFVEAITALEGAGAQSYVFDVRNNPGGQLMAVLGILEYILPDTEAPLVRQEYKNSSVHYYSVEEYITATGASASDFTTYAPAKDHEISGRIAVLCDEYTASAGELFTACLMDYGKAEIYGTQTYGKGVGQTALLITDYYALNANNGLSQNYSLYFQESYAIVPTFYYSPPVSENYHGVGVTPHHAVSLSDEAKNYYISLIPEELDDPLKAAVDFVQSDAPFSATTGKEDSTINAEGVPNISGTGAIPQASTAATEGTKPLSSREILILGAFAALLVAAVSIVVYFFIDSRHARKNAAQGSDSEENDQNNDRL